MREQLGIVECVHGICEEEGTDKLFEVFWDWIGGITGCHPGRHPWAMPWGALGGWKDDFINKLDIHQKRGAPLRGVLAYQETGLTGPLSIYKVVPKVVQWPSRSTLAMYLQLLQKLNLFHHLLIYKCVLCLTLIVRMNRRSLICYHSSTPPIYGKQDWSAQSLVLLVICWNCYLILQNQICKFIIWIMISPMHHATPSKSWQALMAIPNAVRMLHACCCPQWAHIYPHSLHFPCVFLLPVC